MDDVKINDEDNSKEDVDAFHIFFKGSRVSTRLMDTTHSTQRICAIRRICSITPVYFLLLSQDNNLYEARFNEGHLHLQLHLLRCDVEDVDVQYCEIIRKIYIVTENGFVLTQQTFCDSQNIISNNLWKTIAFDPLELSEEGVCIKRVCCSSEGTIFISASGDVYAAFGADFSVDCDQPKRVRLFQSQMEILDLNAGDQFFVFLARRCSDLETSMVDYGELPDLVYPDIHNKSENEMVLSKSTSHLQLNIQRLIRQGNSLLNTEVYTMGSVNSGLLGTGDHIKRDSIFAVEKLKEIGVCSLATGRDHTVVRTIDGCLYHWGLNNKHQLSTSSKLYELCSPTELPLGSSDPDLPKASILEICCGDYRTVLLNSLGEVYESEKKLIYHEKDFVAIKTKDDSNKSYPLLLASSKLTIYNRRTFKRQFQTIHHHLQTQTKVMIRHRKRFQCLKKFVEKMVLKDLQHICSQWENVLYLVIVIFNSLEKLYRGDFYDSSQLVVIKYFKECIKIFETYSNAYCDIYSIDGVYEAQKMFQNSQNSETPSSYNCNNDDVLNMFQLPFHICPYVTQLLESIQKSDGNCKDDLQETATIAWNEFVRRNRIDLELAENTRDFWQLNKKNTKIFNFKQKERRVLLCSTAVPIKLSHSMGLITPVFILFSDCLCQVGNHVIAFPLDAMWLKKDDSGITIKTPEKTFLLISRNNLDKDLWYDQLESAIKSILNLSENLKIPEVRLIDYNYSSNHPTYPGVYVKGSFSNGFLHGKCRLEFPHGKIYTGDVIHGVIEGYGYMYLPKIGLYKGYFKNGKFCGRGTLIISEREIYEGNFRNGLFHGHGHLQNSDYVYVGEFQDNLKCGYGVIYLRLTGEKYLGMFADNKRNGTGICITSEGHYFEGLFVNDELAGKSVAILPNYFYYEGELSLAGPNGTGKYYMPASINQEHVELTTNSENTRSYVNGNILNGQLSGTWENVRISAGSIEINTHFPMYPKTLGNHSNNHFQKWNLLFNDFENEIFGDMADTAQNSKAIIFALWNRVVAFINKQQEIDNEKELPKEFDIRYSTSPSTRKNTRRHFWPLHAIASDFDKISLNSSSCSIERVELNKSRSMSEDKLNALDFSNFDLLSTFGKSKHLNFGENQVNNTFSTLIGAMDTFKSSAFNTISEDSVSLQTKMDLIPVFGFSELNEQALSDIKQYLKDAFNYRYHPLKHLNDRITYAFQRSYGCWQIKPTPFPLLARQAMCEWESISLRVYKFIRRLFPALPEEYALVGEHREVVSHITLLYPILLSEGIYSTLFVLYANKYSHKDELYRQNVLQAEQLIDELLLRRLEFDEHLLAVISTDKFSQAVQMLKKLKENYSPVSMLTVIENCMEQLTHAYQEIYKESQTNLNADVIMPLTLILLLRSGIHHLGAELALLDDFTDSKNFQFEMNGIRGYCYTTLKASYEHLANKSLFENY